MRNRNMHVFLERDGCWEGGGSFFEGWDDVELGDEAPLPTMRMFVSVGIITLVCMCYYINADP